jgi:hypothetical protein
VEGSTALGQDGEASRGPRASLGEGDLKATVEAAKDGCINHYETAAKLGWSRQRVSRVLVKFGEVETVQAIYVRNNAARMAGLPSYDFHETQAATLAPDPEPHRDVTTPAGRKNVNLELQVKDLQKEIKRLTAEILNQENFFDRVVTASTTPLPKPSFRVRRSARRSADERGILLPIFDMQVGTKVVPDDTVGGIGHFDSSVLKERAERYVEIVAKVIRAQVHNFSVGPIVFALGGDMIEGDEIFHDQAWQIEMPAPDQVILARDLLGWMLNALMGVGAEVGAKNASVLCVPGNHGRRGKKGGGRHKRDSFDVLVYKLLREKLKNHPIHTFAIEPAGNCTFDVMGNLFSMIHGDEVKGWGSLPFYGLTRHDAKMIRTLNVIPEYVLLGHHHTPAQIPIGYGEHFMSGNWIGATNLSGQVGSNVPQQMVFMVDTEHGVLDRIPIKLDSRRKPQPTIHQTA